MTVELVIEAGKTERQYWKDLWHYRELFYKLTWRDVAVRYKQTAIGAAWAVLRPLLTMLALTFVFGRIAELPSDGKAPYALMVFAATLPWQLFASALTSASESLVNNASLISKVYFPRMLVPAATAGVAVVDFMLSLIILALIMLWYQFVPPLQILAVIPLTVLAGVLALGPGLILCALNVTYRDFRYIVPFITQFGIYISPVGFSSSVVPDDLRLIFECNPMVGVIEGFRWAIIGAVDFPTRPILISAVFGICLLVIGIIVFRKTEATFADVI